MTCNQVIQLLAAREPGTPVAGELAEHLSHCTHCHATMVKLDGLQRVTAVTATEQVHPDHLTNQIMMAVRAQSEEIPQQADADPYRIRLPGWSVVGVLIAASLVTIQYSRVVEWLRANLGPSVDISLGIMLGVGLTIYICMLVASNLTAVRKFLHINPH